MICIVITGMFLLASTSLVTAATINEKVPTTDTSSTIFDDLDQYNDGEDWDSGHGVGNNISLAQSFKPTYNILTRIEIGFLRNCFISHNVKLVVRSSLDGNNIVNYVTNREPDVGYGDDRDVVWLEFDFPDTSVNPEQTYYMMYNSIGKNPTTGAGFEEFWLRDDLNAYERGNAFWLLAGLTGSDWIEYSPNKDFWFRTYGRDGNDGNNRPSIPDAPNKGSKNNLYTAQTTDPDGEQIYYMWDWGDKTFSDWLGPYDSGSSIETEHMFSPSGLKKETYDIRIKAKDTNDAESEWSEPLTITKRAKEKTFYNILLSKFSVRFPLLLRLLNH
jgi:hypothetical protein